MVIWTRDEDRVAIPEDVVNLRAFRRWTDAGDFPDEGNIWWLQGEVWVDMSKEDIFTHIRVKTTVVSTLDQLAIRRAMGLMLGDGLLLSNFAADICGNPDGTFISNETLRSDRIRLIEGAQGGFTELQGSPDMVLEVVSRSSVHKDTVVLKEAYWEAGVKEYWLIDARGSNPKFDIFRRGPKGFVGVRKAAGWLKSEVFGQQFRLVKSQNELGHPEFRLEVK